MSEGPQEPSFADVLNGISGGAPRRKSGRRRGFLRRGRDDGDDDGADDGGGPDAPAPGGGSNDDPTGAWAPPSSPGGPPSWSAAEADDTHTEPRGLDLGPGRHELSEPEPEPPDAAAIVRPYAWTRGRTRPAYDLAVETLVSTTPAGRDATRVRQYEHRAVADLCREPRSVAEVGALLRLPLGVARVLLGDMASQGTVVVHETAVASDDVPDMALMERVLSGLRRL